MHRLHVVHAAIDVHQAQSIHHSAGEHHVGAHVGEVVEAHAEDARVRVERHLRGMHDVARLLVAEEHFRARAAPLHRPAQGLRGVEQRAVFRVGVETHAEAPADLLGHHPHLLRRHAEHRRELPAHRPDALRGAVDEVQVLRRIVAAHRRARLHRVADHARVVGPDLHYLRSLGERGVGRALVAADEIEHQVARRARMELRRARRQRLLGAHHGRQVLVVHHQRLGRVLRLRGGLGHHQGHRLADVAHDFVRERQPLRLALLRAVLPLEWRGRGDRLQSRPDEVLAREHRDRPRALQRLFLPDRSDPGVRPVRAHEIGMDLAGQGPVGDIASPPGKHALVFEAALHANGDCRNKKARRSGPFHIEGAGITWLPS